MKKVFKIVALVFLCGECIAQNHKISFCFDTKENTAIVKYNQQSYPLNFEQEIEISGLGKVTWYPDTFHIRAMSSLEALEVISENLPVTLCSIVAKRCDIQAPQVGIVESNLIENLVVKLKENDGLLCVVDDLRTKSMKILGNMVIAKTGHLSALNQLEVELSLLNSVGSRAKIENNGLISANEKVGNLNLISDLIINKSGGIIKSNKGIFQFTNNLYNEGLIEFNQFLVKLPIGYIPDCAKFLQRSEFVVKGEAQLPCGFESFGHTKVNKLRFANDSTIKISKGNINVSEISGHVSSIQQKSNEKSSIGSINSDLPELWIENVESGELEIKAVSNQGNTYVTQKSVGKTIIEELTAPNVMIQANNEGELRITKAKGTVEAISDGKSKLLLKNISNIKSVTVSGESEFTVSGCNTERIYLEKRAKGKINEKTKVIEVNNRGYFEGKDIELQNLINFGEAIFAGLNSVEVLKNKGKAIFGEGDHKVNIYRGECDNPKSFMEVRGSATQESSALEQLESMIQQTTDSSIPLSKSILLQGKNAKVFIRNLEFAGIIQASLQMYKGLVPKNCYLKGNIGIILDRVPAPSEIPAHESAFFCILANIRQDFLNQKDTDYKDVTLGMIMNDHKWKNYNVNLRAAGLIIRNASDFTNDNGIVSANDGMRINAKKILSKAERKSKIETHYHHYFFWESPEDVFYYSNNNQKGISVSRGDLDIHADSIETNFSNIDVGGSLKMVAKNSVRNIVGNIIVKGSKESIISAPSIENTCLPMFPIDWTFRNGDGSIDRQWKQDVLQSHGAKMSFNGDITFIGHVENIGSDISSSNGSCHGDISSKDQVAKPDYSPISDSKFNLTNKATVSAAAVALDGSTVKIQGASVKVHEGKKQNINTRNSLKGGKK